MKWVFWGSTKHPSYRLPFLDVCWVKGRSWDCNLTFRSFLYFYFHFQSGGWMVPIEMGRSAFDWLITVPMYRNIFNRLLCLLAHFNPNKNSAKRGIICPWQVIRCSTLTGSCIIQCSGYKLLVELQKKKKKKKKIFLKIHWGIISADIWWTVT